MADYNQTVQHFMRIFAVFTYRGREPPLHLCTSWRYFILTEENWIVSVYFCRRNGYFSNLFTWIRTVQYSFIHEQFSTVVTLFWDAQREFSIIKYIHIYSVKAILPVYLQEVWQVSMRQLDSLRLFFLD